MEIFDLYDRSRNKLNKTIVRGNIIPKNAYHLVTTIWVIRYDNKILLTERDVLKEGVSGLWENTRGGVLSGENTINAAIRELKEETNINICASQLTYIGTVIEDSSNQITDTFIVRKDINENEIVLQRGETSNYKFVTIYELEEMIAKNLICKPVAIRYLKQKEEIEKFIYKIDDFFNSFKLENNMIFDVSYKAFHFCNDEYSANLLLELVISNQKKATSSLLHTYNLLNEDLPQVGDYSVICDYYGNPRCIIKNTNVRKFRYSEMTYDIVKLEGEDLNLLSWQNNHMKFFLNEAKNYNFILDNDFMIIFEEFKLIYKK